LKKFLKICLAAAVIIIVLTAACAARHLAQGRPISLNDLKWEIRNQFPPRIRMEFLGEVKINPELDTALKRAEIMTCDDDGEINGSYLSEDPWIMYIFDPKDRDAYRNHYNGHVSKESLEAFFGIDIALNTSHTDNSYVVVCLGSAIESIETSGVYQDESRHSTEPEGYTTDITFRDGFDGNMLYFYRVNRPDFMFNYGRSIRSLDAFFRFPCALTVFGQPAGPFL